jgi:Undecaprenyl-phosphate galactose phosphotransferase WbaP
MESQLTTTPLAIASESVPTPVSVSRPLGTVLCLITADICAVVCSLSLVDLIRSILVGEAHAGLSGVLIPAIVLTLCSFVASQLYPGVCENPVDELRRLVQAASLTFVPLAAATFVFPVLAPARPTIFGAWLLSVGLFPIFRAMVRSLFSASSWWGSPVVILGAGQTGKSVLRTLTENRRLGLRPVAILDDNPETYQSLRESLLVGPLTECLELGRNQRISYAIVCMPGLSRRDLLKLLDRFGHCFSHVMVIPDLIGMTSLGLSVREVGGIIGLEVTQKLLNPSAQMMKRIIDITVTLMLAPVVLLMISIAALLVKWESPGPILFANERVGFRGRKFTTWKLRSMSIDGDHLLKQYLEQNPAERTIWETTQKLKRDPRITRVGRIIRKTSIDELPQLWNVLVGDMSLVGPRPMFEAQVPLYGAGYALYKRVRPGITGLWQVSGRNNLTFAERARMDAYTVQNWSVWFDIYILARTIWVVLTAKGAY